MKTSQTFFYNEENGNIQYLDKRGFIGELCIAISKKDKNILCLDEIKKIYNLSYKDIVKKFEKVFKKLDTNIYGLKVQPKLGLICLIDKSTEDFEKYCKKNKLKFGQEVSNINKKNLFTKEGKCDIINYKPKESKEELKSMNKKLVKRVAVASLAALMTIPNLNMPVNNASTVYAAVTDPGLLKSIKKCQDLIEKYKAEGNEVGVKTWTKNLENTMRNAEESQKLIDERDRSMAASKQRQAEANAKQAEAERIANKVYPLEYNGKPVYYTKDFIEYVKNTPELNDFKPHWYEAADMPGLKWQMIVDEYQPEQVRVIDGPPTIVENMPDSEYEARFNESSRKIIHKTQVVKVTLISPFESMGGLSDNSASISNSSPWHVDHNGIRRSGAGGDGYIARGANVLILHRDLEWVYGDGWEDNRKGITLGSEQDPVVSWRGALKKWPRVEPKSVSAQMEFNTHIKEGGRDVDFSRAFGKTFEIIYDGVFNRYDINNDIADEYK